MKIVNQVKTWLSQKQVRIWVGLLVIYILLHKRFEHIISATIVDHVLSFCQSNLVNDTTLLLAMLFTIGYFGIKLKNNYVLSGYFPFLLHTPITAYRKRSGLLPPFRSIRLSSTLISFTCWPLLHLYFLSRITSTGCRGERKPRKVFSWMNL